MDDYLTSLLKPPGPYSSGFPEEALAEIRTIHALHSEKYSLEVLMVSVHPATEQTRQTLNVPDLELTESELVASSVFEKALRW